MTAASTTAVSEIDMQTDVTKFANFCVYVRGIFEHLHILYESTPDTEKEQLFDSARVFFGDLNHILIEYVVLQICKITDPEKQFGKRNHTIEFFVNNADFSATPEKLVRLKHLQASMDGFRSKLKPARDKLISHLDRDAVLADASLGAAATSDWSAFWLHLQEFVAILHDRYVGSPLQINRVGLLSDTDGLIKALRQSSYFETMLRNGDATLKKKCLQVAFGD